MKLPLLPPDFHKMLGTMIKDNEVGVRRYVEISLAEWGAAPDNKYRHWDTLRHLTPPEGFTPEEWWFGIKLARKQLLRTLPLKDQDGRPFKYAVLEDITLKMLRDIDRQAAGALKGSNQVTDPHTRDTYIMRSLIEESITSSQLEGASTTREVAKEMIQTGRTPRNKSERMILNNFHAMMFIRQIKEEELTPSIIFELHALVTQGTLDSPDAAGRFRRDDEQIKVFDQYGNILHTPPPASMLEKRLREMCNFANDNASEHYIHPVIRSILLHFWLAYDHPFVDGNGRTARALFYWSMAHWDYWLCEFLSISRILTKAPSKYARSFLYTETDENDATYFIIEQLQVIIRAINDLHEYLHAKSAELYETKRFLQHSQVVNMVLNNRQLALINHALKNPYYSYSIASHQTSHRISYHTARTDLLNLANQALLEQQKIGKTLYFVAPPDLKTRLQQLKVPAK